MKRTPYMPYDFKKNPPPPPSNVVRAATSSVNAYQHWIWGCGGGHMLDVISPSTITAICLKRSADAARDLIQRSSFFFLLRSPSSDHLFQNCARAFADLALRRTEPS